MSHPLLHLVRSNIARLQPYSSARDEFSGQAEIWLDANENPFPGEWNRYPDPRQRSLKAAIAKQKGIPPESIFVGNGSDEAIDLLLRIFCQPGIDHIITLPPTYGMYRVAADLNDVGCVDIPLDAAFQPDVNSILERQNERSKLLFLCSPNNPTGNQMDPGRMLRLLREFRGIVVVDEAYIDFAEGESCLAWIEQHPNLVVLQTFSKAWGLAGLRLGLAVAQPWINELLLKAKPPYNVNAYSQKAALQALANRSDTRKMIEQLQAQRTRLAHALSKIDGVRHCYPSQANFILARCQTPRELYRFLLSRGIVVRDRSRLPGCEDCLRFTIGTPAENDELLEAIQTFYQTKDANHA